MGQIITRATMTLVYLLAMQVAMADGEGRDRLDEAAAGGGQDSGPSLVRIRSGPATLSDSVFRMLYSELRGILVALDPELEADPTAASIVAPPQSPEDVRLVLSEMTTLLLYVCDTPICRRILSKPSWIALLLELVRLGPISAQQRVLRLLRSLLPWCPPRALEADSSGQPLRFDVGSLVSSNDPSAIPKTLVLFLLELIARPYEQGDPQQPLRAMESSTLPIGPLALAQEALALVATLLLSGGPWAGVTMSLIQQALEAASVLRSVFGEKVEASTLEALTADGDSEVGRTLRLGISALCVLGGGMAFLYPGGRVEVLGAPGQRGRRAGVVVRADFARGDAEVKLDVVEGPAGLHGSESGASGSAAAGASTAAGADKSQSGGTNGESRIVALDALRAIPGVPFR